MFLSGKMVQVKVIYLKLLEFFHLQLMAVLTIQN